MLIPTGEDPGNVLILTWVDLVAVLLLTVVDPGSVLILTGIYARTVIQYYPQGRI